MAGLLVPVLSAVAITASVTLLIYTIRGRSRLGPWLTVDRLGRLEGDIPDLERVIIMCHKVEPPDGALRDAVERNFGRGVRYLFLISHEHAHEELRGYYRIFQALAQIHIDRKGGAKAIEDLVDIKKLLYTWDDYPYIFYQSRTAGDLQTVAYRGSQRRCCST